MRTSLPTKPQPEIATRPGLPAAVAKALYCWLEMREPCNGTKKARETSEAFTAAMRELHAAFKKTVANQL